MKKMEEKERGEKEEAEGEWRQTGREKLLERERGTVNERVWLRKRKSIGKGKRERKSEKRARKRGKKSECLEFLYKNILHIWKE